MPEERKVIYGTDNFGYAMINTAGEPQFDAPVMLPGMTKVKVEITSNAIKVKADNKTFATLPGIKVRDAEATVLYIPYEYYTDCLGYIENKNKMVTDTGIKKNHCIFFTSNEFDDVTKEETLVLHYLYNVSANEPSFESETVGDEITPTELNINYSADESTFVKDDKGNEVGYGWIARTKENAAWFDTFKTKVLLPTEEVIG